jgi:uncharacterized protein
MSDEALSDAHRDLTRAGIAPEAVESILAENQVRPQLSHASPQGPVALPLELESEGTQALLSFAPVVLDALRDGSVVVIDEVDSSLHPGMVRALVRSFVDSFSNPNQAQLIITTHDTSLLGSNGFDRVIDRDQMWITEKNPVTGASDLIAVAEYSPRQKESLERGYLTGRYGGIPHLPDRLFSSEAV